MEKYYRIGKMTLRLSSDTDFTDNEATLPFLCEENDAQVKIEFTGTDKIFTHGKHCVFAGPSVRVYEQGGSYERVFFLPVSDKAAASVKRTDSGLSCRYDIHHSRYFTKSINLLNAVGLEYAAFECGMFFLHSSFVEINKKAVLFAGSSGAGKSTRAELFEKYAGANIVNHDKALLYFENGSLIACGSPISGSSPIIKNEAYPVAAIVFPKKSENNSIKRLHSTDALTRLIKNTIINTFDSQFYSCAVRFACECVNAAPLYEAECDISCESVMIQRKELNI